MYPGQIYYLFETGSKKNQEDYIWPVAGKATEQDRIFIVCDGVGGSENGEIASRIIAESLGKALQQIPVENITTALINKQLSISKQKLLDHAVKNGLSSDMATTFCLLALAEKKAFIAWSGDSRVYHVRNSEILYKTADHSLVNTLIKSGEISEEEALSHPQKNIILKAIKADESPVESDNVWIEDVRDGDYFLLCTDGIFENVTDNDFRLLLNQNDKGNFDLIKAFQKLCFNKTRDNYSMYVIKIKAENTPIKKQSNLMYLILIFLVILSFIFIGIKIFSHNDKLINTVPPAANSQDSIQVEIVPTSPKDSN